MTVGAFESQGKTASVERPSSSLASVKTGLLAILAFVCVTFAVVRQTDTATSKYTADSQIAHLGEQIDRMTKLIEKGAEKQHKLDEELKIVESVSKAAAAGGGGKGGEDANKMHQIAFFHGQGLFDENVKGKVVLGTEHRQMDGAAKDKKGADKKLKDGEGLLKKEEKDLEKAEAQLRKGQKAAAKKTLHDEEAKSSKIDKDLADAEKSLGKARKEEQDAEVVASMVDPSKLSSELGSKHTFEVDRRIVISNDIGKDEVKIQEMKARQKSARERHDHLKLALDGGHL